MTSRYFYTCGVAIAAGMMMSITCHDRTVAYDCPVAVTIVETGSIQGIVCLLHRQIVVLARRQFDGLAAQHL
jgi:hypothetical protein